MFIAVQNWVRPKESDCLIKAQHCEKIFLCFYIMWILPSASNVNATWFGEARVNSGSNYDSLKVAKCLVI